MITCGNEYDPGCDCIACQAERPVRERVAFGLAVTAGAAVGLLAGLLVAEVLPGAWAAGASAALVAGGGAVAVRTRLAE